MILVKEAAPDPASLGVTNGITQFAMVRPSLACRRYPRTLTPSPDSTVSRALVQPRVRELAARVLDRLRARSPALPMGARDDDHLLPRHHALAPHRRGSPDAVSPVSATPRSTTRHGWPVILERQRPRHNVLNRHTIFPQFFVSRSG